MSIRFHRLPRTDPLGPHVKYIEFRNAGVIPLDDDPPLGYARVHFTRPIPNVVIGGKVGWHQWIFQVQGFNDGDDPDVPDPIGTFGYVHVWPAVKSVYHPKNDIVLVCDEAHQADYENAIAFEMYPICPFYTQNDLEQVRDFYESGSRVHRVSSTMFHS